jgi:hypothetical protein
LKEEMIRKEDFDNNRPSREELLKSLREKTNQRRAVRIGESTRQARQFIVEAGGKRKANKKANEETEKYVDLLLQQFGLNPFETNQDLRKQLLTAIKIKDEKTLKRLIDEISQEQMGVAGSGLGGSGVSGGNGASSSDIASFLDTHQEPTEEEVQKLSENLDSLSSANDKKSKRTRNRQN